MKKKKLGVAFGIVGVILVVGLVGFALVKSGQSDIVKELERGHEVSSSGYVMLSAEKGNVTITAPGEYVLTGENKSSSSIIVDSKDVILVLEDAKINTGKNAGIINLTNNELIILAKSGTSNSVFGGSKDKYNAPVYSKGNVVIGGEGGTLIFGNRQAKSQMVLVDEGKSVSLAGGTIISLDLEDWGDYNIAQKTLNIDLGRKIKRGSNLMISNNDNDVICDFEADIDFEKMSINAAGLKKDDYHVFVDKKEIKTEATDK